MTTTGRTTSMRCPKCGSDDTARLQTIHEHGTGRSVGGGIVTDGQDVGFAATSSVTMTDAARRAAPPEKKPIGSAVAAVAIAAVCIVAAVAFLGPAPEYVHRDDMTTAQRMELLVGIVVVLAGVIAWAGSSIVRAGRFNSGEWPGLYSRWIKRWSCRRCGATWVPEPAAETAPPAAPPPRRPAAAKPPGPARYRIEGVDRASKMDTVWHCTASSEANARAKAELEGIVVTAVERE